MFCVYSFSATMIPLRINRWFHPTWTFLGAFLRFWLYFCLLLDVLRQVHRQRQASASAAMGLVYGVFSIALLFFSICLTRCAGFLDFVYFFLSTCSNNHWRVLHSSPAACSDLPPRPVHCICLLTFLFLQVSGGVTAPVTDRLTGPTLGH